MAVQEWMKNLCVAYKTLLPYNECQAAFDDKVEDIAAEFEWLREIADEAFKLFGTKSTKLEVMPKTPSMKAKGQKRGRQKVIENKNKEQEESPTCSKFAPTKLKFTSPEEVEDSVNESNRPVRRCRVTSKAVYIDENEVPKRSTRQSRTALNSKVKKNIMTENNSLPENQNISAEKVSSNHKKKQNEMIEDNSSSEEQNHSPKKQPKDSKGEKNVIAETNSLSDEQNVNTKNPSNTDVEVKSSMNIDSLAKNKKPTPVLAEGKFRDRNFTVKDRTKAYECMLKQRVSQSPVLKCQPKGTPGSANKTHIASVAKVNTPMKEVTVTKDSDNKPISNSKTNHLKQHHEPRNSSHRRSDKRKSSGRKLFSEVNGERQTRTRLKLKKQEQNTISEPRQPSNSESSGSDDTEHVPQEIDVRAGHQKDNHCIDGLSDNDVDNEKCSQLGPSNHIDILNETETVITEVFELTDKGQHAKLKEYEIIHTKTTPIVEMNRLKGFHAPSNRTSDQEFGDETSGSSDECEPQKKKRVEDDYCNSNLKIAEPMPTRTRTRAQQKIEENSQTKTMSDKDSGLVSEIISKADITFTKDKPSPATEVKGTRTRTRTQKEPVSSDVSTKDTERTTRTRQRKQEEASNNVQDSKLARAVPVETHLTGNESFTVTRSKMRKIQDNIAICRSDDEIVAGSPLVNVSRLSLRGAKKRLAEERGLSPRPKRSCIGDQSCLNMRSPQLASSPIKKSGADLSHEENDTVTSPLKSPRPYKFSTAQKKTSGFLNRTPGFGQNTSKLYSFLSSTPTCRNSSFLTSFLKRNTPPPKQNSQILAEQKRQKLLEKENQEKERLKKAAELRKRKIEDQKRLREEKEQKVAEAREMRLRNEMEQKSRINKKFEDKAMVKEKLLEERCKEEREKQKQRLRKQMEADARRKMEEEERLRKRVEQEEEAKMHTELMQRKREYEEAERKRQIAEDKRKHEERLAELEQKRLEETARLRQVEEERERERERIRLEKERQIAYERAEKERLERERREEKERKVQEEIEKLKALEKERLRLQQEKMLQQKQEAMQQNEIRQMINKHNTSLSKQSSSVNISMNGGNTSKGKINSYDMTPTKVKVDSKNKNPENYDIDDRKSDDSTDDEEAPIKQIPEWATGVPLNTALIRQHCNPPDLEAIFRTHFIEPPNLMLVFPGKKKPRYHQRTSSAIWNSPPLSLK